MTSTGAIYLDRTDKKKIRMEKFCAALVLIILLIVSYLVFCDYITYPDPNKSECNKIGVSEPICPKGTVCKGIMMECNNSDAEFKYFLTNLIFDKPMCDSDRIYKRMCISKEE